MSRADERQQTEAIYSEVVSCEKLIAIHVYTVL